MEQVVSERPMKAARSSWWKKWLSLRTLLRVGFGLVLLVIGGALALVGERFFAGYGPPNETRVTTFQDWRVICPPFNPTMPNCALTIDVFRDTGGILMTVSLLDPAPNSSLSVTVPHGVALDAGLGFAVGTDPMRVRPFETCNNAGCIALVTMDVDTLRSMSTNMSGQITIAAAGNPMPVNIPFSLRGFSEGYAELQRAQARRTSMFGLLSR